MLKVLEIVLALYCTAGALIGAMSWSMIVGQLADPEKEGSFKEIAPNYTSTIKQFYMFFSVIFAWLPVVIIELRKEKPEAK